jgi:rhodanese-related sulfurtransferase
MNTHAWMLALVLSPAMALADSPAQVSATAAPTAAPLYVNYTPPEWAKAKEHLSYDQAIKASKDKRILFVDARAKVEYDMGHIPGAIPMPSGEFEKYYAKHLKRIKKAKKLVTYCHGIGCRLSEKTANSLFDKGHKNVAVFFGGWPQWQEHKMPEERGDTFASDGGGGKPKAKPQAQPAGDHSGHDHAGHPHGAAPAAASPSAK